MVNFTVQQIVSAVNPTDVLHAHIQFYGPQCQLTEESFICWQRLVMNSVGEQHSLSAGITLQKDVPSIDGYDYSVNPPRRYALDFTPWQRWKLMPVVDLTGLNYTKQQLAAILFEEMTWHGFPTSMEVRRDQLIDGIEKLKRSLPNFPSWDPNKPSHGETE